MPLLVERTSAGASRPAKAIGPDDGMPYRMNAVATTGMGGADRRPNREAGVLCQTDVKHCASNMLACCMAGQLGQISVVGSSRNWYSQCPTSRWTRPFSASFRISCRPLA